jgi:hypothetical protein
VVPYKTECELLAGQVDRFIEAGLAALADAPQGVTATDRT